MAHLFNIQSFILIKYQLSNNCQTVLAKDIKHVSFSCFNCHTEILLGLNHIKLPIMAITQVQPNAYQWCLNTISKLSAASKNRTWGIYLHSFFFISTFNYLFIYLFIYLAVLGLRFCARASSSCGEWGPLFIVVCGPLTVTVSLVAEHRLQTRRLSSCGSRA